MSKGQRSFYRLMYILSLLPIVFILLAMGLLIYFWISKANELSYALTIGPLSIGISPDLLEGELVLSHLDFVLLIIYGGLFFVLFWNVKNFFLNLVNEKFFVMENVRAIRHIGISILILAFYNYIPFYTILLKLIDKLNIPGINLSVQIGIDYGLLFSGLAILAVSQLFKEAVRIKEENELTI